MVGCLDRKDDCDCELVSVVGDVSVKESCTVGEVSLDRGEDGICFVCCDFKLVCPVWLDRLNVCCIDVCTDISFCIVRALFLAVCILPTLTQEQQTQRDYRLSTGACATYM